MNTIHKVLKTAVDALLIIKERSIDIEELEELQNLIDIEFQKVMEAAEGP